MRAAKQDLFEQERMIIKIIFEKTHVSQMCVYFLVLRLPTGRKPQRLTGSVVLVVVDELWNGAEEVLVSKIKCCFACLCLFDLVMFHLWSFLAICPAGNKEQKKVNGEIFLLPLVLKKECFQRTT